MAPEGDGNDHGDDDDSDGRDGGGTDNWFGAHLTSRVTPLVKPLMTTAACLRLVMKKKLVFLDQKSQVREISFSV